MSDKKSAGGVIMLETVDIDDKQADREPAHSEMPKVGPQGQSCGKCGCCASAPKSPIGLCRAGRPHMTIYFRPPTIAGGPPVPDSMAGWPVVHLDENWCIHDFVAKDQH